MSLASAFLHALGRGAHRIADQAPPDDAAKLRSAGDALHSVATTAATNIQLKGGASAWSPLVGAILGSLVESAFQTAGANPPPSVPPTPT